MESQVDVDSFKMSVVRLQELLGLYNYWPVWPVSHFLYGLGLRSSVTLVVSRADLWLDLWLDRGLLKWSIRSHPCSTDRVGRGLINFLRCHWFKRWLFILVVILNFIVSIGNSSKLERYHPQEVSGVADCWCRAEHLTPVYLLPSGLSVFT